jgi:hypothetical protein
MEGRLFMPIVYPPCLLFGSLAPSLALCFALALGGPAAGAQPRVPPPPAAVPLGAGLNGEIDWSRDEAFVDMVKTSRGFYALADTKGRARADA